MTNPAYIEARIAVEQYRWLVFPLPVNSKLPRKGSHSFYDASNQLDQLFRWGDEYPRANYALATGQHSRVAVIDVDPRHGGDDTIIKIQQQFGALPRTATAKTQANGLHHYLTISGPLRSRMNLWGSGVEVKADGNYTLLPGSQTKTGRYEWLERPEQCPLAPAPAWLVEQCNVKRDDPDSVGESFGEVMANVLENTECHSLSSLRQGDDNPLSKTFSGPLSKTLTLEQVIMATLPERLGQRNNCLLSLGRGVKFNLRMKNADAGTLRQIAREWHERAIVNIGTQSFDVTLADFLHGFKRARYPLGVNLLDKAAHGAGALPGVAANYESEPMRKLVGLCAELARMNAGRFFLSGYSAAERIGVEQRQASRMLRLLENDGVIVCVERGTAGPPGHRRATRYLFPSLVPKVDK